MASERDSLARVHEWLYVVIVVGLSIYLIIGVVVWGWLLLTDRSVPTGFATVLSTIIGGLIGVLAPVRPSKREPVEP
jgi:hypothetical protein